MYWGAERCCRAGFLSSWCLFLATNTSVKGFKKCVNIFMRRERDFTRNVCLICHRLLVFLHWWLQYGEWIDGSLLRGLRNTSSGGGAVRSPNMLVKLFLVFITPVSIAFLNNDITLIMTLHLIWYNCILLWMNTTDWHNKPVVICTLSSPTCWEDTDRLSFYIEALNQSFCAPHIVTLVNLNWISPLNIMYSIKSLNWRYGPWSNIHSSTLLVSVKVVGLVWMLEHHMDTEGVPGWLYCSQAVRSNQWLCATSLIAQSGNAG